MPVPRRQQMIAISVVRRSGPAPAQNDDPVVPAPAGGEFLTDKTRSARNDDFLVDHDAAI